MFTQTSFSTFAFMSKDKISCKGSTFYIEVKRILRYNFLKTKEKTMGFKNGEDLTQQTFFPPTLDEYVMPEDPVRVYDAFVDALDFKTLSISLNANAGAERYNPKSMLKLILYGYAYGIRSSRLLEKANHHNLSFIWIMRQENRSAIIL